MTVKAPIYRANMDNVGAALPERRTGRKGPQGGPKASNVELK